MVDVRLIVHLRELGATDAQLAELEHDRDLIGLAGDLRLAAGLDLSVDDVARAAGTSGEDVREIYQLLGLHPDALAGFGERDVALVAFATGDTSGIVAEIGPQILRVIGSLIARLAEAAVAAYVQDVETPDDTATDPVALARRNAVASELVLAMGDHLATILRHHMWAAVRRQRDAQSDVGAKEILRMAVGFVDLVGFTTQSRSLSPSALVASIEDFEQRAFDTATRHGGRIVKSIGDEVMIAAGDAGAVAAIALELIASTGDDPSIAPRGGVSAGDVLFRLGDYYGPVVNLASRLTTEAVPGEVLTDQPALDTGGLVVRPAGRRMLKGIAEPVEVWSIEDGA